AIRQERGGHGRDLRPLKEQIRFLPLDQRKVAIDVDLLAIAGGIFGLIGRVLLEIRVPPGADCLGQRDRFLDIPVPEGEIVGGEREFLRRHDDSSARPAACGPVVSASRATTASPTSWFPRRPASAATSRSTAPRRRRDLHHRYRHLPAWSRSTRATEWCD